MHDSVPPEETTSGEDPQISSAPDRRANLVRLAGSALTIGLLIYLFAEQGWAEIVAALRQIAPWRLFLALGLMLISRLAVSGRWYILLRSSTARMSFWQSARITFAGLFANNFLPTTIGGDVIRLAAAVRLGYGAAVCTASLIADRLIGMAGMAMTAPMGVVRFFQIHPWQALTAWQSTAEMAATTAVLPALLRRWLYRLYRGGRRLVGTLYKWRREPRCLILALLYTWVHMICLFAVLALIFDGMGEPLPLWWIAGLYSLVYFVTLLPVSINGYGVQELSMTLVFSSLGGASRAGGLTAALLFRTLLMLASLPGAVFIPEMMGGKKNG